MTPYDPTTELQQPNATKRFTIADLFDAAAVDPVTGGAVTTAIGALIAAVQAVASQRGLL